MLPELVVGFAEAGLCYRTSRSPRNTRRAGSLAICEWHGRLGGGKGRYMSADAAEARRRRSSKEPFRDGGRIQTVEGYSTPFNDPSPQRNIDARPSAG